MKRISAERPETVRGRVGTASPDRAAKGVRAIGKKAMISNGRHRRSRALGIAINDPATLGDIFNAIIYYGRRQGY